MRFAAKTAAPKEQTASPSAIRSAVLSSLRAAIIPPEKRSGQKRGFGLDRREVELLEVTT
jgi:hypothetical protein